MFIQLILNDASLDEAKLQGLTRDLCESINKNTPIQADFKSNEAKLGDKGDEIGLGVLLLSFISGGGALALIDVLKAYVQRNSSLEIVIKEDGRQIKISSKNIQAEKILLSLTQLLDSKKHD